MNSKGILFMGEMVRAILDGRKCVTRRLVKPQPRGEVQRVSYGESPWLADHPAAAEGWYAEQPEKNSTHDRQFQLMRQPYKTGDILYVKETFRIYDAANECACYDDCTCAKYHGKPIYRADSDDDEAKWRSSLLMPRTAARIILLATDVRCERLQEITPADCEREGFALSGGPTFREKWDQINSGNPWKSNPWVWRIAFDVLSVTGWDAVATEATPGGQS